MMIKKKAGEVNTESRHRYEWEMFPEGLYFLSNVSPVFGPIFKV